MQRLIASLAATAALGLASYFWPAAADALGLDGFDIIVATGRIALMIGWIGGVALSVLAFFDLALWHGVLPRRSGRPTPKLVVDLVSVVVWIIAAGYLFARLSDQALTGIIATSSVAVAVTGFALRSLISDMFSGIAVSLERPYAIGDWIDLGPHGRGQVLEMTWRTTRIRETSNNVIIIPNSRISELTFRNTSLPDPSYRDSLSIVLDLTVSAARVERVLLSAVQQVPEIAQVKGTAYVSVESLTEHGVLWKLVFTVPHMGRARELRDKVWRNVMRNLYFAGITAPALRQRLVQSGEGLEQPNTAALDQAFLHRIELFRNLTVEEIEELYAGVSVRIVEKGKAVVRQGESGDSLFVLSDGLLDVRITPEGQAETSVAVLKAGEFFGEMSLLTGAPRSATIVALVDSKVFEINRDPLRPIMQQRENLATAMSQALADRQIANQKRSTANASAAVLVEESKTLAAQFLVKIKGLFGLSR